MSASSPVRREAPGFDSHEGFELPGFGTRLRHQASAARRSTPTCSTHLLCRNTTQSAPSCAAPPRQLHVEAGPGRAGAAPEAGRGGAGLGGAAVDTRRTRLAACSGHGQDAAQAVRLAGHGLAQRLGAASRARAGIDPRSGRGPAHPSHCHGGAQRAVRLRASQRACRKVSHTLLQILTRDSGFIPGVNGGIRNLSWPCAFSCALIRSQLSGGRKMTTPRYKTSPRLCDRGEGLSRGGRGRDPATPRCRRPPPAPMLSELLYPSHCIRVTVSQSLYPSYCIRVTVSESLYPSRA